MAETFSKKEKEKKKQQKKQEKEQRKAERKANAKSGSLENMMAYVDENGNISDTPPDPTKKRPIKESEIVIGSRNIEGMDTNPIRKGRVTHFNDAKGYGFIKDAITQESIFVHINSLTTPIRENDIVTFETQYSVKGPTAVSVKKV